MTQQTKSLVVLDTGPLITLSAFVVRYQPVIEYILPFADVVVVDTVAEESTANLTYTDARIIQQLLANEHIMRLPVPQTEFDVLIDNYTKLGQGERDTIRLALTLPTSEIVLDDFLAFIIASRFDTRPIILLDLIVQWVQSKSLDANVALEIVNAVAPRYSPPFVEHTRKKLTG